MRTRRRIQSDQHSCAKAKGSSGPASAPYHFPASPKTFAISVFECIKGFWKVRLRCLAMELAQWNRGDARAAVAREWGQNLPEPLQRLVGLDAAVCHSSSTDQ